jgi:hypothetical protein
MRGGRYRQCFSVETRERADIQTRERPVIQQSSDKIAGPLWSTSMVELDVERNRCRRYVRFASGTFNDVRNKCLRRELFIRTDPTSYRLGGCDPSTRH